MASISTRLTEKYGLSVPIVQAGMAFAGMTPPLGIAVSEAGGMGSIAGVGIIPPEGVRMLIGGMNAGTEKPYHVNFITIFTTQAHIDLMCVMKPKAVSFHWGHPDKAWIDQMRTGDPSVFGPPWSDNFPNGAYRRFWWIRDADRGDICARGVFGQFIYVDPESDLVIALVSSWPDYLIAEYTRDTMRAFDAIRDALGA